MELRPYQQFGIDQLRRALSDGYKRIVFYLATGAGKSVVATVIVKLAIEKGKRVVFLVNRAGLVHQFSRHLTRAGIRHGILQSTNTNSLDAAVIVGTVQTAARRGLPMVDLVIIDEAHAVPGSTDYLKLMFRFSAITWIGLTATPFSRGMAKTCAELGDEPLFQDMVVAATIQQLIRDGYLVDVEIYAPSEPDLSGVGTARNAFGEMDYQEKQLAAAVDKPSLIGDIVRHWHRLANGKPTICFASSIAHSKHIVEQFRAAGVVAEHLDGYMSDEEREPIVRRFETGETMILSNVAVLREGFDVPACEVMILARPTKSLIAWIQMAGRVLRPYPGKGRAIILDHSGSAAYLGYPTDDLPLELDDGTPKKSSGARQKEESKPKKCPSCSYVKPPKVHECPACGFKPERQPEVEVEDGELVRLKRTKKPTREEKQVFYSQLLGLALEQEWKPYRATFVYRDKFGVYPKGLDSIPMAATDEVRRFVTSRAIAYRKRNEAGHADASS